jgi:hypothetical protein
MGQAFHLSRLCLGFRSGHRGKPGKECNDSSLALDNNLVANKAYKHTLTVILTSKPRAEAAFRSGPA